MITRADFDAFITAQMEHLKEVQSKTKEEMEKTARDFHAERCVSPEDEKEECMDDWMTVYYKGMAGKVREERLRQRFLDSPKWN